MTDQLGFDFTPEQRAASREHQVIADRPLWFAPDFAEWLTANWHVWREFEKQVQAIVRRGFTHYSARTIVHFMRHHTAVTEAGGGGWKINNNVSPDLARLYVVMHPEHDRLFEFRLQGNSTKRAA